MIALSYLKDSWNNPKTWSTSFGTGTWHTWHTTKPLNFLKAPRSRLRTVKRGGAAPLMSCQMSFTTRGMYCNQLCNLHFPFLCRCIIQACLSLRGRGYEFPSANWGWWIYADSYWETLKNVLQWLQPVRDCLVTLQSDALTLGSAVEVCNVCVCFHHVTCFISISGHCTGAEATGG